MSEQSPDQVRPRWGDSPRSRKNEFLSLLNDPAFKDVFNEKYIEGLERRRDLIATRAQKAQVIQFTVVTILLVSLLSVHLSISFFGLSTSDIKNLREWLLLVSASIQFSLALQRVDEKYVSELLAAYAEHQSKGNEGALHALHGRFGLGSGFMFKQVQNAKYSGSQATALVAAGFGALIWLGANFVATFAVQVIVLYDILTNPSFSLKVSILVASLVVLVDAVTFSLLAITGSLTSREASS